MYQRCDLIKEIYSKIHTLLKIERFSNYLQNYPMSRVGVAAESSYPTSKERGSDCTLLE